MKLIIAEKPSVAKSIASALVLHPGPMAFLRAAAFSYPAALGTWYPRWMRAAMTNASKNGAMTIFPFCRSRSAMCWHRARRTHLKIYAP